MIYPTYTAAEIKNMCLNFDLDFYSFKILIELIERELHLYSEEDLIVLMQASIIVFNRSLLQMSLRWLLPSL